MTDRGHAPASLQRVEAEMHTLLQQWACLQPSPRLSPRTADLRPPCLKATFIQPMRLASVKPKRTGYVRKAARSRRPSLVR